MMDDLRRVLEQVAERAITTETALERLRHFPVQDLEYAQVDHLRPLLQGHQEIVLGQGKTPEQVVRICESLAARSGSFLVTRADSATQAALRTRFPRAEVSALGRTVYQPPEPEPAPAGVGTVLVVTAGTSDLPVAEEARPRAPGRAAERRRGCGYSSRAASSGRAPQRFSRHRGGRDGWGAAQRGWRVGECSRDCCSNERRVRCVLWRRGGAPRHAQLMCLGCAGGEHR